MDLEYIFWSIFACFVAFFPIVCIKQYIHTKNSLFLLLSLASYCLLMYSYTRILPEQDMTLVHVTLVSLFVALLVVGVAWTVYRKK
jgi:hypothetical protein